VIQQGLDLAAGKNHRTGDGITDTGERASRNDDAEIKRLAKLSPLEYDRERKAAADRLNIRAKILDALVEAEREKVGKGDGKQGRPLTFPDIEPWAEAEAVAGAELLTELSATIRGYVVVSNPQADALALWSVFTHSFDAFDV